MKILRRIKNNTNDKVDCYWLTGEEHEVFYETLEIGQVYSSQTYSDHRWNVRMHKNGVLLSYSESITNSFGNDVSYTVDCLVNMPSALQCALNDLITKNEMEKFWKAKETLSKVLLNIIQNTNDDRYKTVKASNQKIKDTLIDVKGAVDFLLACGFTTKRENNDYFLQFPTYDQDFEKLKKAGELLMVESATLSKRQSNPLKYEGKSGNQVVCDACKKEIDDGKDSLNDAWLLAKGEFRYECEYCKRCLCSDCYDVWRKSEEYMRNGKQEKGKCDHNYQSIKPKSRGWDWTQGGMPNPPEFDPNSERTKKFWGW